MKIKRIEHIAVAVEDMDFMAKLLGDKFGLDLEYTEERMATERMATRIGMLPVGETYIELLQGVTAVSGATKWLMEKEQSLFHICFEVENIDEALAELKAKGTPLLNDEPIIGHANCRIAFIDPKAMGNLLFELAEMPKGGHAGH